MTTILKCPYGCRGNFATCNEGNKMFILCGTCWRIFVIEQQATAMYGNDHIMDRYRLPARIYEEDTGRPMTARIDAITVEQVPDPPAFIFAWPSIYG